MNFQRTSWIAALVSALSLAAGFPAGPLGAQGAPPAVEWEKTLGGPGFDYAFAVRQTADGGFIIAGQTNSSGAGQYDAYLIRTDGSGELLWEMTYGGPYDDSANSVHVEADGGYIFAGRFSSRVGETSDSDVYLVRTDGLGSPVWERTFGGPEIDAAAALAAAGDGGFVLAGETGSSGAGKKDVYLIRTDALGDAVWERAFGGPEDDSASSLQLAADGGCLIAGQTASSGAGLEDVYLLKTDGQGNLLWEKTFGGAGVDRASSVRETIDGGAIIAGHTGSSGDGDGDVYLIRTDERGNLLWEKAFGGPNLELSSSIIKTADEGFIFDSVDVIGGRVDLIRTDLLGNELWRRPLRRFSVPYAIRGTEDGGLIAAGLSSRDVFLVKTAPDPILIDSTPPAIEVNSRSCASEAIVLEVPCAGPEGAIVDFTVSAVDDRDPSPAWSCDRPPGSAFPLGATAVACEAADSSGNRARCEFTVSVADRLPPEIACPGDLAVECIGEAGAAVDFTVTARDGCDPAPAVSLSSAAGSIFPPGTHTVTATATDRSGNSASCAFRVTVTCSGAQVPGDCNQDRRLDIADAICIIGVLFTGTPRQFPCGDGSSSHPGNRVLLDWQPDGLIDISDPVAMLQFIFLGHAAHPLAVPGREDKACVPVPDCPDQAGCG